MEIKLKPNDPSEATPPDQKVLREKFHWIRPLWLDCFQSALQAKSLDACGLSGDLIPHLLAGDVQFSHAAHHQWIPVGRRGVDWKGGQMARYEWPAQLNRFFHLGDLTQVYLATSDERYAEVARDHLEDWIEAHPGETYQPDEGDNPLTLACRCGGTKFPGWQGCLPFLALSPSFDDAFCARVLESVSAQLRYLLENLTAVGNWRMMQADALAFAGLAGDSMADRQTFYDRGFELLNEAAVRQFDADGSHTEHNPHYHILSASILVPYWRLGREKLAPEIRISPAVMKKVFRYAVTSLSVDGKEGNLQDCHAITNEESKCAPTPGERRYLRAFPRDQDFADLARLTGTSVESLHQPLAFFPQAGQVFLRSGSGNDGQYLSFDATRWGGSHCHLSRNAVEYHVGERRILRDLGSLTYDVKDPMMAYGKSTRAHNTVNLNGWNQSPAEPTSTRAAEGAGRMVVASDYEGGYWSGAFDWRFAKGMGKGIWARHHRMLFWAEKRFALVADALFREPTGTPEDRDPPPSVECNWQFDANNVQFDLESGRAWTTYPTGGNLLVCFVECPPGTRFQRHEGEVDPPRGWVPRETRLTPSPQFSAYMEKMQSKYAEFWTLLIPFEGVEPPVFSATITRPDPIFSCALDLTWGDGSSDEVEWTVRCRYALGERDFATTDAHLIHREIDAGGDLLSGVTWDAETFDAGSQTALYTPLRNL